MRRLYLISILIYVTALLVNGQVIDTTRSINTWMLKHNYTRFEDVPLDTNTHQLQHDHNPAYLQGFSYESVGILGHGLNHVDFMRRPDPNVFLFGRAWNPYLKTADRTVFFNTKTPFTRLSYSTIPVKDWKEETIEIMHTQNFSPYTNIGIDFNILGGKPLYTNQETKTIRAGLFASHAKNRYSIFGTFYYNDFKTMQDNGGIANRDSFEMDIKDNWWLYEVNLQNARSHYRNMNLFTTQKYNLAERQFSTDSLGITTSTGKTLSISYQLEAGQQFKKYYDEVDLDNLSPVYSNYYYLTDVARDSAVQQNISSVLQLILGDPDYDKISARIYAGHEFKRFGMLSPDSVVDSLAVDTVISQYHTEYFNDVFLGLHLAGPTTGVWDWVIDGKYYLLGYNQNNFNLNTTFSRELGGKTDLGLRGSFELARPHYFTMRYSSSFFKWDNDFSSMLRVKGEAFVQSHEVEMDLRFGAAFISNYIYWDTLAMPRAYDKDLLVLSAQMSKHFKVSGYNSDNRLLIQYSTAKEVLNLPFAAIYSSNYWKQSLFKGALVADFGFDVYFTTKYHASGYMPATGVFNLQDKTEIGMYPFVDVFFAFRIKSTRLFASYNNVLQSVAFAGNEFFTAEPYPMKPRHFRLGLVWYFYD